MNVLLFGASGMVGQGALRECLAASSVKRLQTVGRTPLGEAMPRNGSSKLTEIRHADIANLEPIAERLRGFDACLFCLGVSSSGMSEAQYTRLTHDLTLSAAATLARLNPGMRFLYVSGAGTDRSEKGGSMWARVKGRTENDLARLPFAAVYLFRPGIIQPLHGIRSKTPAYRWLYSALKPLLPLLRAVTPPGVVLTTESVGRAMLEAMRRGGPTAVFEAKDIAALGS